ncbi:MAG: hypothetical protein A2V65_11805 [Deltaproteobacteria bacterium RBG_13_49_15]|nr:MAG: hypothetical protein A2V65_11805 [Deltaproteobacteria bacterium RBG_13_49_15]
MSKKKAGSRETIISVLILFFLTVVAAVIYIEQFRFSSTVSNLSEEFKSRKDRDSDQSGELLIAKLSIPESLVPLSPPVHFNPLNLSEKIDGKAELYLSAGFIRLETQRLQLKGRSGEWMEIFIYHMGKPENAFAVFSAQKRGDSEPAGIGDYSYRTQNALFLVHGPYYVEFISSSETESGLAAMKALGLVLIKDVAVKAEPVLGASLFPKTGLLSQSLEMIPENAFGFEKLNQVWTVNYRINGVELSGFLSKRSLVSEAQDLANSYANFLLEFGGKEEGTVNESGIRILSVLDGFEAVFSQGVFLGGVHQATDRDAALMLARNLKQHVKGMTGGF